MNNTRIYCYSGGYAKVVNGEATVLSDHYYLDVSRDFIVSNSYSSWTRVLNPPDFVTEPTTAYVSVKLSDTSVLINGGTGVNNNKDYSKNQTTIYHADQNRWETVQSISSFPQTYYGSGALTKNNAIVFYGGSSIIGDILPTFNGTATLSMTANNYHWSLQASSVPPGNHRYGHTATTDQSGQLIYYFGGRTIARDSATGVYSRPYTKFLEFLIFHTDSSIWESKIASSTVVPSGRMSHTTNLIPNSDKLVIYGGAGPDSIGNRFPVKDYMFTYDTKTNVMQPISVPESSVGAGPKFGHSASTSNFHILDLDTYSWKTDFSALEAAPDSTNTTVPAGEGNNGFSKDRSSPEEIKTASSLSSGAIAGIVVGILAVVGAILAFLLIRRHNKRKQATEDPFPSYWDVTSINNKKLEDDAPITSTGPVDITRLPGYTTCRTGLPTNITNDKDVNPPSSKYPVLSLEPSKSPETEASSVTYTSETKHVLPPDAYNTIVTPSAPIEFEKPDAGKK
ncbi:hypothetical protein INT48_009773 [Thamnidium elegans]|uniref:Attractin/MKLN-like beta-propeller domain-containing protein n=1 Tax=Thamnidium elegans TaxID=101142 RepID=A0A8H7VUU1_9FUNG|nr:hypothetical protein INT48_009773 [Thamnidium elegans]